MTGIFVDSNNDASSRVHTNSDQNIPVQLDYTQTSLDNIASSSISEWKINNAMAKASYTRGIRIANPFK